MLFLLKKLNHLIDYCLILVLISSFGIAVIGIYNSYYLMDHAKASHYSHYRSKEVDFKKLKALNKDVVAWLNVEGTHIDYPVVQGRTNLDYVNKSVEGDYSLSGSVFLDYRNHSDFTDSYAIIYAHHMDGDVMFGELPRFRKKSFFRRHKSATIYLADGSKKILKIFACLETDAYDNLLFNPTGIQFSSLDNTFLDYIKSKSIRYRAPKLNSNSHIVALSTCEDTTTDGRVLVIGVLS